MKIRKAAISTLAGLACPLVQWSADGTRLICSFESPAEFQRIKTTDSRITRVTQHATDGRYAAQVDFEAADQPKMEIAPQTADFRPFASVALDVVNPSDESLSFAMEVEDASGAKTVARTALPLGARESATFALPLNSPPPLEMGMRGEAALPGFRLLAEDHHAVDTAHIAVIRIYLNKPGKARLMILDNIRLLPAISYEKIVDAYGQSAREEWPGKLTAVSQFQSRRAEEEADLKLRPSLPDRDEYGAWASGPKLEATGFFHAAKHAGQWWLVAPNGRLFFSIGLDCVTTREGGTVVEGRENMFQSLPPADDPLAAHYETAGAATPVGLRDIKFYSGKVFNFYSANLQRKYGADWKRLWQETALARLRAWGVNTIANWSDAALYGNGRVPYTVTLGIRGAAGEVSSGSDYWGRMRDVFDPRFAQAVDDSVRAMAQARRDDPWCVGYFVDNELAWGNMRSERSRYGLALGALSQGAESAAKRAFADQARARYASVERLNEAWGSRFASWDDFLAKPYQPEGEWKPGMREDLAAFMKEFATRYFRTIRDALKKYDPHHLYLGSRFSGYTREEVLVAAEYCDVISFNIYRARVNPAEWSVLDGIDKPVVIGEFHMGALDRGMFHPGLVSTPDQAARAAMYEDYVRSVADHPLFVGCHFFKFNDEPLTGRPRDGENYNIGFTTVTDSVYPELVAAAKAVHGEVYARHSRAH
ncbi:MAG TPA: beta-galactosidase [Bryobacteraceae bacterium]|nr:beta-galactosidase [Bryobacteraceae bacterium]